MLQDMLALVILPQSAQRRQQSEACRCLCQRPSLLFVVVSVCLTSLFAWSVSASTSMSVPLFDFVPVCLTPLLAWIYIPALVPCLLVLDDHPREQERGSPGVVVPLTDKVPVGLIAP